MAHKVWHIYREGFMKYKSGIGELSYTELKAYLDLTGDKLDLWEVDAIKSLDTTYNVLLRELTNGNRN